MNETVPAAARAGGSGAREYLGVADLADYLRVTENTVRHWRKRGFLPAAYLLGTRVLWRVKEIERWVREKREKKACFPGAFEVTSTRCTPHARRG